MGMVLLIDAIMGMVLLIDAIMGMVVKSTVPMVVKGVRDRFPKNIFIKCTEWAQSTNSEACTP